MTDTERSQRTTELMTRYGTDIKRFCLLQLRDASQAEDAAQDVSSRLGVHSARSGATAAKKPGCCTLLRIHVGITSVRGGSGSWTAE